MNGTLHIGIDPGTTTGMAIWYRPSKTLWLHSGTLIKMYIKLKEYLAQLHDQPYLITIEDAGKAGGAPEKMRGAWSVRRDCKIWREICEYHNWHYQMIPPIRGATKWDAKKFRMATGYQESTNQHNRDAAMLVYGK